VDISNPSFDPIPYGIPLERFMYEMHAIDGRGNVYRGVDAVRVIWQAFPTSTWYGLIGALVNLPVVHLMGRLIYRSVARMRRFLPGNREPCKEGSCGLGKGKAAHT
jgi:predicted DCC family thiol-disulfide oxidoreductase YuxK